MKRYVLILLALALCGWASLAEERFEAAESYDPGARSCDGGEVALIPLAESGDAISAARWPGDARRDYADPAVYTLRDAIVDASDLDWNPHAESSEAGDMLIGCTNSALYSLYINEDRTGYAVMPEMAADYPEDVTAEYAGQFGVQAGEAGRAYRIRLNPEARWDLPQAARDYLREAAGIDEPDTAINADTYIYSMRQLLNPKMRNPRAEACFPGDMRLCNADAYRQGGWVTYQKLTEPAAALLAKGREVYLDMDFWGLTGAKDASGGTASRYVPISDDTPYRDEAVEAGRAGDWISAQEVYRRYLAEGQPFESYQVEALFTREITPEIPWEDVGIRRIDDYTVDLILEAPLEDAAFSVPYNLSRSWLVYAPLYEACKRFYDEDGRTVADEAGAMTVQIDYCRSLKKTAGCGPYKLARCNAKRIALERGDWYGYRDGKHRGMYQTDQINIAVMADHAAVLSAYQAGELDIAALRPGDGAYASGRYASRHIEPATTKLTFNTDYGSLLSHGNNSQVLAIDAFREAIARIIDRQALGADAAGAYAPGYGLISGGYIGNPYTGAAYPAAEADASAGYDVTAARRLINRAYDEAVEASVYDGEALIILRLTVDRNDAAATRLANYLDEQLKKVCEYTGFADRVSVKLAVDEDYYNTNYLGGADMIVTTWEGPALDACRLMARCYTDAADGSGLQMEYGYDTSGIALSFDCDGMAVEASLRDWSLWAAGEAVPEIDGKLGAFADYGCETRCAFLRGMEAAFLKWHPSIPLYDRGSAFLRSARLENGSRSWVNDLVGFGGLAYINYECDDALWGEYFETAQSMMGS